MSNIGATFNALVELPNLAEEYFRNNLTVMLRTASSLLANMRNRPGSTGLCYWELVLDSREDFINRYLAEYDDYLRDTYPEKSEVSDGFFLNAKLQSIPTIVFVFDEALKLSIQLQSNIVMAQ